MAILDSRLLPFIEMLAELGMDWLAFELVDGIRRGKEPIEDDAALRRARDRAQRASDAEEVAERFGSPGAAAIPILGDDQLEWAARYVEERLRAAFDQIADSLDALDEIVAGPEAQQSDAALAMTRLVLRGEDSVDTVGRAEVDGAKDQLEALRGALDAWVRHERDQRR